MLKIAHWTTFIVLLLLLTSGCGERGPSQTDTTLTSHSSATSQTLGAPGSPRLSEQEAQRGLCDAIKSDLLRGDYNAIARNKDEIKKLPEWDQAELLIASIQCNSPVALQKFIEAGLDLKAADRAGMTPLAAAVDADRADLVQLILDTVADATPRSELQVGSLQLATSKKSDTMIRKILTKTSNPNHVDMSGLTPLGVAVVLKDLDRVNLLINLGVSVNAPVASGKTPLAMATTDGSLEIARALMMAGADPDASGARPDGRSYPTAREIAVRRSDATGQAFITLFEQARR